MLTLPSPDDVLSIARFAESFDGYEWCGSVLAAAKLAGARPRRSMEDLRAELFFAFRASRHSDDEDFVDVYRELMWHFLRVAREANLEIEVSATRTPGCPIPKTDLLLESNPTEGKPSIPRWPVPPAATIAIKTYLELQKEIEALQVEADRRRREEAIEVLARIKAAINLYGFTAGDFGFIGPTTEPRPVSEPPLPVSAAAASSIGQAFKYGDDKGNVWSGRGPRPAWFRQAIADGKKPGDLLAT